MPTKHPRINITFEPNMIGILDLLAKQEHKSVSGLAKELILDALERREDMALSVLAKTRDIQDQKTIKHRDVWK